jgi:hypothetical protein
MAVPISSHRLKYQARNRAVIEGNRQPIDHGLAKERLRQLCSLLVLIPPSWLL